MCSAEDYVNLGGDTNACKITWTPATLLGEYVDSISSLSAYNQDPIFYCEVQDKYLHRRCFLDDIILEAGGAPADIRVMDNVEVCVELYNNDNAKDVVIINNGSDTFDNIKANCEWTLQLPSNMPIVSWKVEGNDVDASEKVFDHITRSGQTIVAVVELLKECKL